MAEKSNEKKGGAGKFFLGALFGAMAGAAAGHLMKKGASDKCCGDGCDCEDDGDEVELEIEVKPSKKSGKSSAEEGEVIAKKA